MAGRAACGLNWEGRWWPQMEASGLGAPVLAEVVNLPLVRRQWGHRSTLTDALSTENNRPAEAEPAGQSPGGRAAAGGLWMPGACGPLPFLGRLTALGDLRLFPAVISPGEEIGVRG